MVEYTYDPWGACTILSDSTTFNLSTLNPFRYRGYYYDEETGLYYLQSRYYDPTTCKFINIDDLSIVYSYPYDIQTIFAFDYCEFNPVMYIDPSGYKIILRGSKQERQTILTALRNLTGAGITLRTDSKGNLIYSPCVHKYKHSNRLINRMIHSKNICTIRITKGANKTTYQSISGAYLPFVGSNVAVHFNPNYHAERVLTKNPNDQVVGNYGRRPPYIGLAHELIHADRAMRGVTIDLGKTKTYGYTLRFLRLTNENVWEFTNGSYTDNARLEELATIGIHCTIKSNDITENMIRKEHGLWERGAY